MTQADAASCPSGTATVDNSVDHVSRFVGLSVAYLYLAAVGATVFEVIARYVFNSPTVWAFEVVIALCAVAWMLSAGFLTLERRHISISVIYDACNPATRWWLDLLAMVVGVFALSAVAFEALSRMLDSLDLLERTGSSFNSPLPLVLKTALFVGLCLYIAQLISNLSRHVGSQIARSAVLTVGFGIAAGLILSAVTHYSAEGSMAVTISTSLGDLISGIFDAWRIDRREVGIAAISLGIVTVLLILMMSGMPLGIVTLIISVMCALLFFGTNGLFIVTTNATKLLENYPLVAIPFFVLMSTILERAGIARDLFDAMSIFAGNFRGGVAVQTTVVAVILAAMSGVMGGEIVMLGLVALPQLLRLGYDRALSIGLICAAGVLATLIPPSIVMIVYGLSASVSLGSLFSAGFTPGLMLAFGYVAYVLIRCNLNHSLAPTAAEIAAITEPNDHSSLGGKRLSAVLLSIALIFSVMGSIYAGIASVTEAAAVGVLGALIIAAIRLEFNFILIRDALTSTMSVVGTIIWLIIGAVAFVGLYNLIGGAAFMRSLLEGAGIGPLGTIMLMLLILLILGTFMEYIAIIFITIPVFAPLVRDLAPELGMTPDWAAVWFGILFVMNMQIYFLSPPFGPACFWLKSVVPKDISLQLIYKSVLPFIGIQIVGMLLVLFIPDIALWLPKMLQ